MASSGISLLILALANVLVVTWATIMVLRNWVDVGSSLDLQVFSLLVLAASPNLFTSMKVLLLFIVPGISWNFLVLAYGISVLLSYLSFSGFSKIMFDTAKRMKAGFDYWKWWIVAVMVFLFIVSPAIAWNIETLVLPMDSFTFKTLHVSNPVLGFAILVVAELTFLPFLVKFYTLNARNRAKHGRWRGNLILVYFELLGFGIFFTIAFESTRGTIIAGSIIRLATSILLPIIFFKPNTIERMFMQLNIESLYIVDQRGRVLSFTEFIPGKNSAAHDLLVGGLVKGTHDAICNIIHAGRDKDPGGHDRGGGIIHGRESGLDETNGTPANHRNHGTRGHHETGSEKQGDLDSCGESIDGSGDQGGLKRIELEDGTAILIERLGTTSPFHVCFTRKYTPYIHARFRELVTRLPVHDTPAFKPGSQPASPWKEKMQELVDEILFGA